jgi:hypothetical protein
MDFQKHFENMFPGTKINVAVNPNLFKTGT